MILVNFCCVSACKHQYLPIVERKVKEGMKVAVVMVESSLGEVNGELTR